MSSALSSAPRGQESSIEQTIELGQELKLASADGSITFEGTISGGLEPNTLLFDGSLGFQEDGVQKGSSLYSRF